MKECLLIMLCRHFAYAFKLNKINTFEREIEDLLTNTKPYDKVVYSRLEHFVIRRGIGSSIFSVNLRKISIPVPVVIRLVGRDRTKGFGEVVGRVMTAIQDPYKHRRLLLYFNDMWSWLVYCCSVQKWLHSGEVRTISIRAESIRVREAMNIFWVYECF